MVIDAHVHLGRNENISASVDELLKSMDQATIDKALVFAGALNACPNEYMLEQIAPHKDRLYGVAAAHPLDPKNETMRDIQLDAIKLARWFQEEKIVAVKFYTGYDHYYPNNMKDNDDYLMELEGVGCPAIFHCGDCLCTVQNAKLKYAHPLGIDDVAVDYPKMNFIIAHMGFPWHRDAAEVCYKNPNVYADISGFVYGEFSDNDKIKFKKVLEEFIEICPANKLLFGTDWPISNQQSYLDCLRNDIGMGLTPEFLTQNTVKAFNIK